MYKKKFLEIYLSNCFLSKINLLFIIEFNNYYILLYIELIIMKLCILYGFF